MSARDWNAIGVSWEAGKVASQTGKNASDRKPYNGTAWVMVLDNFDRWVAHHPDARDAALGALNAQGWRVPAQDVCRKALDPARAGGPIRDDEVIKEAVYARIMGIKRSSVTTVTVHNLPNGEVYETMEGVTNPTEDEFRQMFAAVLVDMGVESNVAILAAKNAKW